MEYTQTHEEFNIGPTRFRFPLDPREDDGTRERLDDLRAQLPDLLAKVDAGKTEAARRRSLHRTERTDREHYQATARFWAEWKAGTLGIDLSEAERVECVWQRAKLTAMAQPRTPTARDRRPYVDSIDQVRSVRFYRECERSGGGYYGAPRTVTGGELIAEIEIAGWDHRAIPAAEGPVTYLYDFQERADRAAAAMALDSRFRRATEAVQEAAAIPAEERTRAVLENLEWWADQARQAAYQRERYAADLGKTWGDDREDYGPEPDAWDRFALPASEDDREAARLEIALYRLYCGEGADGRARPFTGDQRIPDLQRAKRKALTVPHANRWKGEVCASAAYWDWDTKAKADLAWHDGDTVREQFEVREKDGGRWAFLRFAWSPRGGRQLVDVAETTKADTAQAWCEALAGPKAPAVEKQDPERVAALSDRGCFVAVQRGCYIRHVGTLKACQALAGGDVMVIAFPGGWHDSGDPSPLYANARAWMAGDRQRITTLALARWERTRANAHAYCFGEWLQALGFPSWILAQKLRPSLWYGKARIGLAQATYDALRAEHATRIRDAERAGVEIASKARHPYQYSPGVGTLRDAA